jgi:hypothetical protein
MPLRYRKRLSLATLTRTSGVKQREDKNEARTGTAAAVAAAGGKIVAAGDTLGRPGRAGNRTSLEVGTTITLEKSQGRGMRKKNLKQRDRGKLKVLGCGEGSIRRQNRSEDRDGCPSPGQHRTSVYDHNDNHQKGVMYGRRSCWRINRRIHRAT